MSNPYKLKTKICEFLVIITKYTKSQLTRRTTIGCFLQYMNLHGGKMIDNKHAGFLVER